MLHSPPTLRLLCDEAESIYRQLVEPRFIREVSINPAAGTLC